jgi:hypothetical protein
MEWWAGPKRYSEIAYRRNLNQRYLRFSVHVVCGISLQDIRATRADRLTQLPVSVVGVSEDQWDHYIDLDGQPEKGGIFLWVPEVWSPVMVSEDTHDTERKSFATSDWGLVETRPANAVDLETIAAKQMLNSLG